MINYKNFLTRIDEGLITTHDLNKSINIIEREMVHSPSYKINIYDNNTFSIYFDTIPKIEFIDYLFDIINNLGYYSTSLKIWNNKDLINFFSMPDDESKLIGLLNNRKHVEFYFDSKFDKIIKIPDKLYHTTLLRKKSKILKNGLSPKTNNRKNKHPERIYFDFLLNNSINTANSLIKNDILKNKEKLEYCILEINTNDIIKVYKDPHSKGCYTYDNIKPNNIIDLKIVI